MSNFTLVEKSGSSSLGDGLRGEALGPRELNFELGSADSAKIIAEAHDQSPQQPPEQVSNKVAIFSVNFEDKSSTKSEVAT